MKKSQGKKLKTENSAKEAIRKKLRYSKKDNSLTIEEKNKIKKQTKRGRRIIKTEASAGRKVNSDICRHNEDDNVGTESLARGMECAEIALEKVKLAGYSKKIYKRAKKQSEKIETIKKNASNETSKAIQKNRMKRQMIDSY